MHGDWKIKVRIMNITLILFGILLRKVLLDKMQNEVLMFLFL